MNFFKFLNFPLKSSEIPVGLRFQLASVTINFTDNRDYRAVLYSMVGMLVLHWLLGIIMYSVKTSAMTVKAPRQHACAIHLWLCWVCKTRHGGEEVRGECVLFLSATHSGSLGAWRLFLVGFGTSERGIDREFWIETWHELLAHTLSSLPEQPQCIWTK